MGPVLLKSATRICFLIAFLFDDLIDHVCPQERYHRHEAGTAHAWMCFNDLSRTDCVAEAPPALHAWL